MVDIAPVQLRSRCILNLMASFMIKPAGDPEKGTN